MIGIDLYFILFLLLINFLLVYKFDFISKKINFYDFPDNKRKLHKEPVSLLGGSIIFTNFILSLIYVFIFFDKDYLIEYFFIYSSKSLMIFLFILISLFFLGILDDKFNISPIKKFFILIFLISIICLNDSLTIVSRFSFYFNNIDISFSQLAVIFSVGCYVFLIISLNMFDGINLQSSIFYLINLIMIMIYTGDINIIILSIIIGLITFSYLNFKNKVFLGDNGVYFLSFLIGYLYVKSFNDSDIFKSSDIIMFLFLPIIDSLRVMIERQIKFNKPIFHTDRIHFHHKLLDKYNYKKTIILSFIFIIIPHAIYFSPINSEFLLIPMLFLYFYFINRNKY